METETIHLDQELPELRKWTGRPSETDAVDFPGTPAVCSFLDERGAPVQLASTQHLRRFVNGRLLDASSSARRADLGEVVRAVRWRTIHCPFEGRWRYYRLARVLHPRDYRRRIGFGPACFLHFDAGAAIPELRVTERIWHVSGETIGPWPTERAARATLELLWDLFELCRYPEQVRIAPRGKRCAYADMGRCDAPCDGSAALGDYARRCGLAWLFAAGRIDETLADLRRSMERAATDQQFERAGMLRDQVRAVEKWRRGLPADLGRMAGRTWLLCLPVTRRKAWKLFGFRAGLVVDGPVVREKKLVAEATQWMLVELPATAPPDSIDSTIRMEQTWLVAHFLGNRERERAIVIDASDASISGECAAAQIQDALERRAVAPARPEESETHDPDVAGDIESP